MQCNWARAQIDTFYTEIHRTSNWKMNKLFITRWKEAKPNETKRYEKQEFFLKGKMQLRSRNIRNDMDECSKGEQSICCHHKLSDSNRENETVLVVYWFQSVLHQRTIFVTSVNLSGLQIKCMFDLCAYADTDVNKRFYFKIPGLFEN